MIFDKNPANFTVNKKVSYTKRIRHNLMKTEKNAARVEYFLSKWRINLNGGISKVLQSDTFTIQGGSFRPHQL